MGDFKGKFEQTKPVDNRSISLRLACLMAQALVAASARVVNAEESPVRRSGWDDPAPDLAFKAFRAVAHHDKSPRHANPRPKKIGTQRSKHPKHHYGMR